MSDLVAIRGDSEEYTLTCTDAAGSPYDLTGADIWFTVKRQASDADANAVINKRLGNGITVSAPTSGIATVTLDPADTDALETRRYPYDVQLKLADGSVKTPLRGQLVLVADVTRATT